MMTCQVSADVSGGGGYFADSIMEMEVSSELKNIYINKTIDK